MNTTTFPTARGLIPSLGPCPAGQGRPELPSSVQDLVLIVRLLRLAEEMCDAFLTNHPPECACRGCRACHHHAHNAADLVALVRLLPRLYGCVESCLPWDGRPHAGPTFGDDLRALADLSDAADARSEAEGPGGDEAA